MNVTTIDPRHGFVDRLAAGLLARFGDDPLALAEATILLPTRRATRALRDAFLRRSGGRPLLLPILRPIGDVDEEELAFEDLGLADDIPPAIAGQRRVMLLAGRIRALAPRAEPVPADQAVRMASDLARLLDQVQTERLSFDRLADLVPAELARHWQVTLDHLALLIRDWPAILAAEGALDPAPRRDLLLARQAARWREQPPAGPVVAAGSTGSIPATADLLAVVAGLKQGTVVLPGLDREMDQDSWDGLEETHPQAGLKRLLERLGLRRDQVADWPAPEDDHTAPPPIARRALVREVMRPAATTDRWRAPTPDAPAGPPGLFRMDCPTQREEADAIALLLREVLEDSPSATAALVTPDRALARRVAAALERWGVVIDDSAGRPLGGTMPGAFLRLLAEAARQDFAPIPLLALLKHPLAAGGMEPAVFRDLARRLELRLLRGPRPAPGLGALARLAARLDPPEPGLAGFLRGLDDLLGPFATAMAAPNMALPDLARAHLQAAEALAAAADATGPARLWAREAGEEAAAFMAGLVEEGAALGPVDGEAYAALLDDLMAGIPVRPRQSAHPRLAILGPLEARLLLFDTVVLAGLNEGSWPAPPAPDPWMSRPMRARFGLPPAERRIGQAAHDIAQLLCARRVVLTRSRRVEGAPTVPSRWLLRLDAVLKAAGAEPLPGGPWLPLALALDRPDAVEPSAPPAPRPPVAARPRVLPVTDVELWMRNPYAIHAKRILRLRKLDDIDADPGAADYGSIVHAALERFVRAFPADLPADPLPRLLAEGEAVFAAHPQGPALRPFWWPRLERIAAWFIEWEAERRLDLRRSAVELRGEMTIDGPAGPFVLTARADRIDLRRDGQAEILDYKTGTPPTTREMVTGFAPQLPLEAAILAAGGFRDLGRLATADLKHVRLTGARVAGAVQGTGDETDEAARNAIEGLRRRIAAFDDETTPYDARPYPEKAPRFDDYLHLARVAEWELDQS